MRSLKQTGALAVAFSIALVTATACGQWHAPSPIGPSNVTGPAAIPNNVPASGSATISGSVAGLAGAHRVGANSSTSANITVTVVGTNVSTTVDILGRFVLEGVPTGSVQLHFSGPGVDATISMGTVRERERIDVELSVSGTSATIQSSIRIEADDSAEIEGPVTSVTGTCPNLSVTVHGWTVNLSATGVSCDNVRVGIRVRIHGNHTSTDVVVVVRVQVNTPPPNHPPAPGEDDDDDDGDD